MLETERLLEGENAEGKDAREAQMILNHKAAIELLTEQDRKRFIEAVETEIMSLHEGNIARYRLRTSEYGAWREAWRE